AAGYQMGQYRKANSPPPKMLFPGSFPHSPPTTIPAPGLLNLAICRGAFPPPCLKLNSSLRDVLHGFDPFLGLGMMRSADDSFQRLTYGGELMREGVGPRGPARPGPQPPQGKETRFAKPPPHASNKNSEYPHHPRHPPH